VFYVIVGTLSVRLNENWRDAAARSYVVIPGGTPHTFENRGSGGFEARMPDIASALGAEDLRM
jgi:quercetin dioxygenase-like cupin family protein